MCLVDVVGLPLTTTRTSPTRDTPLDTDTQFHPLSTTGSTVVPFKPCEATTPTASFSHTHDSL